MKLPAALATLLLLACTCSHAQNVALVGVLGSKALITVDGGRPKSVAVGETYQGVKLISVQGNEAVVEAGKQRQTVRMGDAPVATGGPSESDDGKGQRVVLTAGIGGHFFIMGQINGKAVPMVIDTGANSVALSATEATRIGLDYRKGTPVQISTANGVVPGWRVTLDSLRVGDAVLYAMDATVSSGAMPYVLLGNSFLSRFQMTRNNEQMVLERRY